MWDAFCCLKKMQKKPLRPGKGNSFHRGWISEPLFTERWSLWEILLPFSLYSLHHPTCKGICLPDAEGYLLEYCLSESESATSCWRAGMDGAAWEDKWEWKTFHLYMELISSTNFNKKSFWIVKSRNLKLGDLRGVAQSSVPVVTNW